MTGEQFVTRRFCANVNKIARGPHLGNPEHHVRGLLLLLGCLLIKSMLFLSFWIESVSSVHINCVSHYFYELTFIFFVGICCHEVSYFVLTTSNMYMMELANSIKHLNFYATRFSCVSPIVKDCLQNCECLSYSGVTQEKCTPATDLHLLHSAPLGMCKSH